MISNELVRSTLERMKDIRGCLLKDYPFYGELAMHLELGVAEVGTAMTDMKHLIVDPSFALRLDDEQLTFVFMHEILHCVLSHCVRGDGREPLRWNIACDIVVNSNILQSMGLSEFAVDGETVMHQDFHGFEGCSFTAEEMYERVMRHGPAVPDAEKQSGPSMLDNHDYWDDVEQGQADQDRWKETMLDVARKWAGTEGGIAVGILKELELYHYKRQLKWKQICRDFIRKRESGLDYNFRPPDRRFYEDEFIYPGLNPSEEDVVEDILFFVDKSGSISVELLKIIMKELDGALKQVKGLRGKLAFFDTKVSTPVPFSDTKELLKKGIPLPSGGTNFHGIFRYIHRNMKKQPSGVVVLTDGYADFPSEKEIKGIPTLWVILDSDRKPKYGKCVRIGSQYVVKEHI